MGVRAVAGVVSALMAAGPGCSRGPGAPAAPHDRLLAAADAAPDPALAAKTTTPRTDVRLPAGLRALLASDRVPRTGFLLYGFQAEGGHHAWVWSIENLRVTAPAGGGGIDGPEAAAFLTDVVTGLGFTPARLDNADGGRLTTAFRRDKDGVEETIAFGTFHGMIGSRPPNYAAAVRWAVRVKTDAPPPRLADLLAVEPALALPGHGQVPVPDAVVRLLADRPVTPARASGTGHTWYGVRLVVPGPAADGLAGRVAEAAEREGYQADPRRPQDKPGETVYVKRATEGVANSVVRIAPAEGGTEVDLSVQP